MNHPPGAREHLHWLRENQRGVLGKDASLRQAVVLVFGFDAGNNYMLLRGFQEWLCVRLGGGFEYHWTGLAKRLAHDSPLGQRDIDLDAGSPEVIDRFFVIVDQFLEQMESRDGRLEVAARFKALRFEAGLE